MDYETYDNDSNESDDDYFEFVRWLEERTASELRQVKGDPQQQRQALCRYWKRGYRANLGPSELIDFLGVDTPSIFDLADYTEEEGDAAMQLSDSLTQEEIEQTVLSTVPVAASQMRPQ